VGKLGVQGERVVWKGDGQRNGGKMGQEGKRLVGVEGDGWKGGGGEGGE